MTRHELVKYTKAARALHWVHTAAFLTLFLTGLVLFVPPLAFLAEDSWTRIVHRIAAAIFIIFPLVYLFMRPDPAWAAIKEAFIWSSEDMGWLQAAPRYYLLGEEDNMPPQKEMNTGQKIWWLLTLVSGIIFAITGSIMWFARLATPPVILQWTVFIHDVSFITIGAMLFLHIYLGAFHPKMTEAWRSIVSGKVSAEYAMTHHRKWYDEVMKRENKPPAIDKT